MGYTITIGQLRVDKSPDDGLDCSCMRFDADGVKHDGAPAFGEPTDHTNERWPSYSAWSNFLKAVDLYGVFYYGSGHLIGGHPGIRLVTQELVSAVSSALTGYRERNPGVEAAFNEGDERCGYLCRLIWLDYWLRWSIENCETPVIANS